MGAPACADAEAGVISLLPARVFRDQSWILGGKTPKPGWAGMILRAILSPRWCGHENNKSYDRKVSQVRTLMSSCREERAEAIP
jgi:hypothetical protein